MASPKLYAYKGEMLSIKQIADRVGMSSRTLQNRVYSGLTVEEAANATRRRGQRQGKGKFELNGRLCTLDELAQITGVARSTIQWRLGRCETVEEAVRPKSGLCTYDYHGKEITMRQAVEIAGVTANEIRRRMSAHGLSLEDAVDGRYDCALYPYKGRRMELKDIAEEAGVPSGLLEQKMRAGHSVERALKSVEKMLKEAQGPETARAAMDPGMAARSILSQVIYDPPKLKRRGDVWIYRAEACTYAVTFPDPGTALLEAYSNRTRCRMMCRRYAIEGDRIAEVRE